MVTEVPTTMPTFSPTLLPTTGVDVVADAESAASVEEEETPPPSLSHFPSPYPFDLLEVLIDPTVG